MTTVIQRREIVYGTLQDFLDDVRQLAEIEVTTLGNWSFAQILEHLARAIDSSIDGFSFQSHWLVRTLAAAFLKNRLLTTKMKPGVNLPRRASSYLPEPEVELHDAREHLEAAAQRLLTTAPTARHPYLGRMSDREWLALHLRHAELHMSFVLPQREGGTG